MSLLHRSIVHKTVISTGVKKNMNGSNSHDWREARRMTWLEEPAEVEVWLTSALSFTGGLGLLAWQHR